MILKISTKIILGDYESITNFSSNKLIASLVNIYDFQKIIREIPNYLI